MNVSANCPNAATGAVTSYIILIYQGRAPGERLYGGSDRPDPREGGRGRPGRRWFVLGTVVARPVRAGVAGRGYGGSF